MHGILSCNLLFNLYQNGHRFLDPTLTKIIGQFGEKEGFFIRHFDKNIVILKKKMGEKFCLSLQILLWSLSVFVAPTKVQGAFIEQYQRCSWFRIWMLALGSHLGFLKSAIFAFSIVLVWGYLSVWSSIKIRIEDSELWVKTASKLCLFFAIMSWRHSWILAILV